MTQKQYDNQVKLRSTLHRQLKQGMITPQEAFEALQENGYGNDQAVVLVNMLCECSAYRSNFTLAELIED